MKVFVTGINGMLGHDVMLELFKRGYDAIGCGTKPVYSGLPDDERLCHAYICLDITDKKAVEETLKKEKPDAVIHCAAWTGVDAAEEAENRPRVEAVNVRGSENLALACKAIGCKIIYISTEFVFDGSGAEPRKADDKNFGPLNFYGLTKLEGEKKVAAISDRYFIVRISWAFGTGGDNFVAIMLRAGKTHDRVKVVNDQIGTPTYAKDVARLLIDMAESEKYGFYHATNSGGYISRYEFCKEMYRLYGLDTEMIPVTTKEYGGKGAERPLNGRLDTSCLEKAGFKPLPDWKDALLRYIKEIKQ